MQTSHSTNPSDNTRRQKWGEIVRFGIVGITATLIQYGVYWVLLRVLPQPGTDVHIISTISMTAAYLLSFLFNFYASTRYTFRVKATARRGAGFLFSHVVNYSLQMLTLNLFLLMGIHERWAPIPMFCVCVPINFLLVRYFLKRQ